MANLEMKSYEDLKNNEWLKSEQQLQNLIKEIDEIKDTANKSDDKIDWVFAEATEWQDLEKTLNQWLLDSLNKQDIWTLQILVWEIWRISRDSSLNLSDNVKKSVDDLLKLMLQVLDKKHNQWLLEESEQEKKLQKKSFDDFKSLIENNQLDDLNGLDDKDIDNVVKFVQDDNNKWATFDLYYKMQNADFPDNFRSTDRKYFNQVKAAIKEKYTTELFDLTSESVWNVNLIEVFKDKQKAEDLNNLAKEYLWKENWAWEKLEDNEWEWKFPEWKTFKRGDFIAKFNEINDKRISDNNEIVENINLAISEEEMKKFTIEDWTLKYDGQEFNQEMMLQQFWNLINPELDKWDFIWNEKANIATKIYEKVSTKIKEDLWNPDTDDVNQEISSDQWAMTDADFDAMKNLLWEKMFIEKWDDGKISYSPQKAKDYLSSLRDTEWKDFKGKFWTPEWRAWVSAVQILLNAGEWDKIKVDWKFWQETRDRVKAFQEKYNQNKPEWTVDLKVDWFPWKNTLAVLLDGKIWDTIFEDWLWHIENWRIVFDNIQEQTDADGKKFIEVEWKKYYEYKDGMNGLWYESGISPDNFWYLFIWNFENGKRKWQWTMTWANWDKYEWQWENDFQEWQWTYTWADWEKYEWKYKKGKKERRWTYTWANWTKYEWGFKNDKREWKWTLTWANWNILKWTWNDGSISEGKFTLKWTETELDVTRDATKKMMMVTSEWEYKGKFINDDTWELEWVWNSWETPSDNWTIDEIDVNGISWTVKWVWNFENGKFAFDNTVEQWDDDLWHYVKFWWEQYYEYKDGMEWKWYRVVAWSEWQVMFWNFKAWKLNGKAYVMWIWIKMMFENVADDVANWKWVVEFNNWNKIQWERKDNNFVEWKYMVKETWIIYDVASDETWVKIVSEWENNWKYIDTKSWDIKIQTVES